MPRLDSSAITKVTYNKKTKKMNVRFAGSGKNYTYINVPEDVYNDFINADSAGRFFNDYVKNDFEFTASPDDFVDSVRFNEEIMKVGLSVISEQIKYYEPYPPVSFGDGEASAAYVASTAPPPRLPNINYSVKGDRLVPDVPHIKPWNSPNVNYYPVGVGPDPNLGEFPPDASAQRKATYKPRIPIPKRRGNVGFLGESPIALTAAGIRSLINAFKKAGPLPPYNYDYYQAIKRRNANRLNRGQY